MLKQIFREYDIRGIADTDLPDDDVELIGKALATHIIRHSGRNVCLGRDGRPSSTRLHAALTKGLLSAGVSILDVGVVPTPVLNYSAIYFKADGALMITGSHDAPEYNGLKAVCRTAAVYGREIQQIRQLIEDKDFEEGTGTAKTADALTPYLDEIAAQFQFERKVRVVFDPGNGTVDAVLPQLMQKLKVDASFLGQHSDLEKAVGKHKAELGISFYRDSDRIGVVDELGRETGGDLLLLLFGREILARKPGSAFIGDVKCSQVIYDKLKEWGGNPIMYKTGYPLLKMKMKEANAELAGEMSGQMIFADRYYGYEDALYTACRLLEIVAKSREPLSAHLAGLPERFSTPELRVDCPDDQKFAVVASTAALVAKDYVVADVDGVRVPFEDGCWGLVRASNTQPVLVMRFEATSQALLDKYRTYLEAMVEKAKAVVASTTAPEPKK